MSTGVAAVLAGIAGLICGSLAEVLAERLERTEPAEGEPPPAAPALIRCRECGNPVSPVERILIAGRLIHGGRYRGCGHAIPIRYAIVEVLTAGLAVAIVLARHEAVERVLGLVLLAALIPISLIDLDTRRIPNVITGPAAVLALVIGLAMKSSGVPSQLIAGAAAAGFLFIFAVAYPRGLGMGDVKLGGVLGLFLGSSVAPALFAGLLSSALFGVGVMAKLGIKAGRKTGIPLGPFLAFGGVLWILVGPPIVHWYVHGVSH